MEVRLRTPILTQQVEGLKLDADAKFVSQQEEGIKAAEAFREEIKRFRQAQEHVVLKAVE